MRSPVEESLESKARRILAQAALNYAARYLVSFDLEEARALLFESALAYAKAAKPPRRRSA